MRFPMIILILINICINGLAVQKATIKRVKLRFNTYMFSDPNPVPEMGRIYPYFRFDGYTNHGYFKEWDMILLENDYIKVYVCPDIGGKVWGAIEKSTGKEFVYFNHAVKFRDIAMRGPWTSGGLEFNFGDIGHIPTCATPVDHIMKEHPDGSVSCVVGAIDLPSKTRWNVKIILQKDKPYFETLASWFNNTSLPVTYYHWMNAAAKSRGDLEFIYPGNKRIGHAGEAGEWPFDFGRKISLYKNNNFGTYKSYHVINSYSNYFGGYWHEDDFGFGHLSDFDEKPGGKIWIWGLSDQGMIWKDLLTNSDGQYIEYQAGKLFNQATDQSTYSPFKHREFISYDSDIMHETWFPLKGTKGMVAASPYAVLNIIRKGDQVELLLSALQKIDTNLLIYLENNKTIYEKIILKPLKLYQKSFKYNKNKEFSVELGDDLLKYSTGNYDQIVDRPVKFYSTFNWNSAYGLYIKALELEKQRRYSEALEIYKGCIQREPTFLPALNRMALGYYRQMDYKRALEFAKKALSIDTYDPIANYIYGLTGVVTKKYSQAKNGFSIASLSIEFRSAAFTELAKLFFKENIFSSAEKYAQKALAFNKHNTTSMEILAMIYRKTNQEKRALDVLSRLYTLDPLNHFINFEKFKLKKSSIDLFKNQITNELPYESYLHLAVRYYCFGCREEAIEVLKTAPEHPVVLLWLSYLDLKKQKILLKRSLDLSAQLVFPHRSETVQILEYFRQSNDHWKLKYYSGLIYWNKGLKEKAKQMFLLCEEKPDFFPFYLAKIKLLERNHQVKIRSLKKAIELNPTDWRINLAWINHYMENRDFKNGEKIARIMVRKHPEKSVFATIYARLLLELGKYQHGIYFLENHKILPYEGATKARNIYHAICIRSAYQELEKNHYDAVIEFAKKAKLWPKNLGVGKPYDVDERLDDFVIAYGYEKLKEQTKADEYYSKIISYTRPFHVKENSKLLLQVMVLKKFNKQEEAQRIINSALKKDPENKYLKWVKTLFYNPDRVEGKNGIFKIKTDHEDLEFKLVHDLLKIIKLK